MEDFLKFVVRGTWGGFTFALIWLIVFYGPRGPLFFLDLTFLICYAIPGAIVGLVVWWLAGRLAKPIIWARRAMIGTTITAMIILGLNFYQLISELNRIEYVHVNVFGVVDSVLWALGYGGLAGLACPSSRNDAMIKTEPLTYRQRVDMYAAAEVEAAGNRAESSRAKSRCGIVEDMKIVIPGGSGQVGTVLARAFHSRGDDVVVLSRTRRNAPWRTVAWDGETPGEWISEFEGADAIINLAGRSVNCRYTPVNRRIIIDSRVKSTKVVGDAIAQAWKPPRVWLQASTATIYAHRFDMPNDEASGIIGGSEPNAPDTWRFSIDVATSWERTFNGAATPLTRKVLMRTAIVMNPDPGSPFDTLLRLVRFGLGGRAGDGKQFMSWIHDQDLALAVLWLIQHEELDGPVNLASPNPVINSEFMQALREAWGMPFGLPATEWMLEVGAFLLRSETELILKSRRVIPTRLLNSGFCFQFPDWAEAVRDLCVRWRQNACGR